MIALIQRVTESHVNVEGETVGKIGKGLLVLLGVERDDDSAKCKRLLERVFQYRVFEDEQGKMNLSLGDIKGDMLVISQFTLAADTRKGRRPSFSSAAHPQQAEALYEEFVSKAKQLGIRVETGQFAEDMKVHLVNDGPVTFQLTV